jgi:ATP/maltotriose-dependent transcriptional regulator MalT
MADIPRQPLTILNAGAGYGKSTALSLFVHDLRKDTCWYTISRQDDELRPFLTKLFQAVKQLSPSLGDSILGDMVKIQSRKTARLCDKAPYKNLMNNI